MKIMKANSILFHIHHGMQRWLRKLWLKRLIKHWGTHQNEVCSLTNHYIKKEDKNLVAISSQHNSNWEKIENSQTGDFVTLDNVSDVCLVRTRFIYNETMDLI